MKGPLLGPRSPNWPILGSGFELEVPDLSHFRMSGAPPLSGLLRPLVGWHQTVLWALSTPRFSAPLLRGNPVPFPPPSQACDSSGHDALSYGFLRTVCQPPGDARTGQVALSGHEGALVWGWAWLGGQRLRAAQEAHQSPPGPARPAWGPREGVAGGPGP